MSVPARVATLLSLYREKPATAPSSSSSPALGSVGTYFQTHLSGVAK